MGHRLFDVLKRFTFEQWAFVIGMKKARGNANFQGIATCRHKGQLVAGSSERVNDILGSGSKSFLMEINDSG
jgi:hypothetical protein